ncbi:type II toxin-antitoxin system HicB family antitoxin [Candidatus Kaiserbacteria bacterium]|nr:type II toxin-antitoxin system HicB family antitoxin [Candidatus Kaiserbacteria bacterium]
MKVLNYSVKVHAAEEGGYWAEVPALPGCLTQGETLDEITKMAKDTIEGYLASLVKHGQQIPIEEKENLVGPFERNHSTSGLERA